MCSCKEEKVHVVARRRSVEGRPVLLWSDGSVTAALGFAIRGLALGTPRALTSAQALEAGWLALDEVCVHAFADVARLVKTARKAVVQNAVPRVAFVRRAMAAGR